MVREANGVEVSHVSPASGLFAVRGALREFETNYLRAMLVVTAVFCTGADSVPSFNKQILLVLSPVLVMLSKLIENKILFFQSRSLAPS